MTGQQLKNSILQMAVQGKLVPQDPNDEPASVLLKRIRVEKEQLIKEGKIKKEKNPSLIFRGADNLPYEKIGKNEPVCIADEVPFDIPQSWEWVRFGMISTYSYTKKKINAQNADPKMWGLDLEDIEKGGRLLDQKTVGERKAVGDKTIFDSGDILYSKLRPYLLKILVAPDCGICTPEIVPFKVFGNIVPDYIVAFLKCPYVDTVINSVTYGVKMPRVGTKTMTELLVPIPPLSEQKRIIKKLCEVEPLADNYTEAYVQVAKLNQEFPELLKKSILQEAIQGKLVSQDPNDEPASILLDRIRSEKQRLIREGKIKKDKHESIIFRRDNSHYEKLDGIERCIDDEIPFEIPESWEWTRLGQIISLLSGTDFKPEEYNDKCNGIPYITGASSLSENGVLINRWTEMPKIIVNYGDILLVCKGSGYGKTVICDIEKAHIARQIMAIKKFSTLDMLYIRLFLQANFNQIKSKGQGVIPGIDRNSVMNMLFPIPPLAEQKRIVEKQRELFDKISLI
jgi:restriction endonuclease S subunit